MKYTVERLTITTALEVAHMIKVSSIKCADCTFESRVAEVKENPGTFLASVVKLPQNVTVWIFHTGRLSEAKQLAEDACRSFAANYNFVN